MAGSRKEILNLYKRIIRESQKFSSYNFRMYVIRRTRDAFRDQTISSPEEVAAAVKGAQNNLEIIKRQALLSQIYSADKLVIEHSGKGD